MTLLETALHVIRAMNRLGAPYAVGGGFAVNAWVAREHVRATVDIDLHAIHAAVAPDALCRAVGRAGVETIHTADLELGGGRVALRRFLCLPDTVLDVIMAREPYAGEALRRRVETRLEGQRTFVLSPEDLIVHKAMAARDQDWLDVAHLVEALHGDVDLAYIERWSRTMRVWSRLRSRLPRPTS